MRHLVSTFFSPWKDCDIRAIRVQRNLFKKLHKLLLLVFVFVLLTHLHNLFFFFFEHFTQYYCTVLYKWEMKCVSFSTLKWFFSIYCNLLVFQGLQWNCKFIGMVQISCLLFLCNLGTSCFWLSKAEINGNFTLLLFIGA